MDYPSSDEMDLDGWDILEEDGFFVGGREFISREVGLRDKSLLIDANYFVYAPSPPLPPQHLIEGSEGREVDRMPTCFEPKVEKNQEEKEIKKIGITMVKEIFLREPKFVDIKAAGPPEIDGMPALSELFNGQNDLKSVLKLVVAEKNEGNVINALAENEKIRGGFRIWGWSINGKGVLCSFGMIAASAATICFLVLGRSQRQKQQHHQQQKTQNQKIRFHVYADDSRIKQVLHHAGRLNQALSAARVIPLKGAQISFGD